MKTQSRTGQTPLPNLEFRQLVEQSKLFARSRRVLVKMVVDSAGEVVPRLIEIATESLDDDAQHIITILSASLDSSENPELLQTIYSEIPKKSVQFAAFAGLLAEAMLMLIRSQRPIDRQFETILRHNLAVHLRDSGDYQRAAVISGSAVKLLRFMTKRSPLFRVQLVTAMGMWSKHLSEAGNRKSALRVAVATEKEARRLRGENAELILARSRVTLGSCLVVESRFRDAIPILRAAYRTFQSSGTNDELLRSDLGHVLLFLACAEFNSNRKDNARETAEKAWSFLTGLVAENPGLHFEDYVNVVDLLSLIANNQGDQQRALQVRGEAGASLLNLATVYPHHFGFRYVWTLINWTSQSIHGGDYTSALKLARFALRAYEKIKRRVNQSDIEVFAVAQFNLGVSLFGLNRRRLALAAGQLAEKYLCQLSNGHERRDDLLPNVRELIAEASKPSSMSVVVHHLKPTKSHR
jgi:hypothetical protein